MTPAGEIRRVICCVNSPCPAGCRGSRGTGYIQATGPEETGTPSSDPPAHTACLESGQPSLPFHQDHRQQGPAPEMPPERPVQGGCWEALLGDGRKGRRAAGPGAPPTHHSLRPGSRDEGVEPVS